MNVDDAIVGRLELTFPDGNVRRRDYTLREVREADADGTMLRKPPQWLEDPSRVWDHPQDPVTLRGRVPEGREADAEALLA